MFSPFWHLTNAKACFYDIFNFKLAGWDFSEETVPLYVQPIARHVEAQMGIVAVWLVIQDTDVPQVNFM